MFAGKRPQQLKIMSRNLLAGVAQCQTLGSPSVSLRSLIFLPTKKMCAVKGGRACNYGAGKRRPLFREEDLPLILGGNNDRPARTRGLPPQRILRGVSHKVHFPHGCQGVVFFPAACCQRQICLGIGVAKATAVKLDGSCWIRGNRSLPKEREERKREQE